MSLAVLDDYFSFMSDKLGSKPVPEEDLRVVIQAVQTTARPDMTEWVQQSQMEVTESDLSDTVIARIFRPPAD